MGYGDYTMPRHKSSSGGEEPAAEPKRWDWVSKDYILTGFPNLSNLIGSWDDQDFRISRAWLCFFQENIVDDLATNHAYLKFDFKDCNNHRWRGFTLHVTEEPGIPLWDGRDEYTASAVNLGFKDWAGPPLGLRYCMGLVTRFDNRASHGTTLGGFIEILSRAGLLRFGFGNMTTCIGNQLYVGCRDYV